MFSRKFNQESDLNPLTQILHSLLEEGKEVFNLTLSNPTQAEFHYPEDLLKCLNKQESLIYSPCPQGHLTARKAISRYYQENGRTLHPDALFLTASTSEAYSYLFKLLCDPDDEIIIPSPSYPLFDFIATLEQVHLIENPLLYNAAGQGHWHCDFSALREAITPKTKAIILVNPNNPTGHLLTQKEINAYLDISRSLNIPLIVDEVFCDYILIEKKYLPIADDEALIFTLNGFSKILGLPQLKLGWIHVAGNPPKVQKAVENLDLIADTFLSVNTPVQMACPELFIFRKQIQAQIHIRLQSNLKCAQEVLANCIDLDIINPEAGWTLLIHLKNIADDEEFACALLHECKVQVHPGYLFGFTESCHIALSLLTPQEIFKAGLLSLKQFITK